MRRKKRNATLSCVVLVLLLMCLQGIVPELTMHRGQTVSVTRVVDAPAVRAVADGRQWAGTAFDWRCRSVSVVRTEFTEKRHCVKQRERTSLIQRLLIET